MVAPMTSVALVLVFGSVFCHASWNFLVKRSDHKVAFLGSFAAVAFVAFLVPTAVAVYLDGLSSKGVAFGLVTAALHGVCGLTLARSYHLGDLSAVYPISRGMGPALIPLGAVLLLDERTSVTAGFGIALVVLGLYVIPVPGRDPRGLAQGAGMGVGVFWGVGFLGEGYGAWRVLGSLLILTGAFTLGLAP